MSECEIGPNNAVALDDSAIIINSLSISNHSNPSSINKSLQGSGGSINIIQNINNINNILSNSYRTLNSQINSELKQKLISDFSKLEIYNNRENNNSDFSLINVNNEILSDKQYKKRKINNDENNLNRSIIFCYLENLVLIKDIKTMKEFIIKFNEMDSKSNYKIYIDANKETVIQILVIILSYLEANKIKEAYEILLKAFIYYKQFDFCLNFFVRKLIYNYIFEKQDDFLNNEEHKKIKELIPDKYKQDKNGNEQLLNNFLEDLINMNYTLPNNEIYSKVIPYIFQYDLNVIIYNNNSNINEIKYKFQDDNKFNINLIFYENEEKFDIFYTKEFYNNYQNILEIINNIKCKTCGIIFAKKENIKYHFNLCDNCLLKEIENNNVYKCYSNYCTDFKKSNYTTSNKELIINIIADFPFTLSCDDHNNNDKKLTLGEIIKDRGLDALSLFEKIKHKICLIHNGKINENNYTITLPCNCKICSEKCLEKFMEELNKKNDPKIDGEVAYITPMSECFCGFKYNNLKDFNNLKKELEKFNNKEYIDIINDTIKNNLLYKCIECRKNYNKTERFLKLKLNDEEAQLICKSCYNINKINESNNPEFYCIFCSKNHKIISYEEFKGFSNPICIIF